MEQRLKIKVIIEFGAKNKEYRPKNKDQRIKNEEKRKKRKEKREKNEYPKVLAVGKWNGGFNFPTFY